MWKRATWVAWILVGMLLSWTGATLAQDGPTAEPAVLGSVVAIDGVLSVQRAGASRWCDGFLEMPDYARDRLRTDERSMAAVQLRAGARIGINQGSEVEILGEGDGGSIQGNAPAGLTLHAGTIWARFDARKEPFRIQTGSALLDIKGTEFTVETADAQTTTLSVLEGEVAYTPLEDGKVTGAVERAGPGVEVRLRHRQRPAVRRLEPGQLRKMLQDRLPRLQRWYVARIQDRNAAQRARWRTASDVVRDPDQFSAGGPGGGRGRLAGRTAGAREFPTGLKPDRRAVPAGQPLVLEWQAPAGVTEFMVMLSRDPMMTTLDWSARVEQSSVTYPSSAFGLQPGQRYFWRVVGVDDQGNPRGRPTQTWFILGDEASPRVPRNQRLRR